MQLLICHTHRHLFFFKNIHFQVPLHLKFSCHNKPSQRTPLHPSPSSIGLTIIDALKFTKYRKMLKSYFTAIDFENTVVCQCQLLPYFFDGDILFVYVLVPLGVPSAYDRSMGGKDKMCDGHPWCTTKTTNIKIDFGLSFRQSIRGNHLQCQNDHCAMEVCTITPSGQVQLISHLLWVMLSMLDPH